MEQAKLGGVQDLFKKSWARMKERYAAFVLPQLILIGAAIVAFALMAIFFGISMASEVVAAGAGEDAVPEVLLSPVFWIGLAIFGIALVVVSFWETAAIAFAAAVDKKPTFNEVWHAGWKFFWPIVWLQFLAGLIVYASFFLLFVPAIYLSVAFAFVLFVCVHEGKRGMAALLRSKELVKGHWWGVFGRFLLGGIAVSIPYIVMIVVAGEKTDAFSVLLQILAVLYEFFVMIPFLLGFSGVLYHELVALKPTAGAINLKKSRWKFAALTVGGYVIGMLFLVLPLMTMLPVFLSGTSDLEAINEWDEQGLNDALDGTVELGE